LARERMREEIAYASLRGRSVDISGTAGLGKSTIAMADAIDICDVSDVEQGHPAVIFAVGGGRGLAVGRYEMARKMVAEAGAEDEINVRLVLGRQALPEGVSEIDEHTAPHGFACAALEAAHRRMRFALAGCVECPLEGTCTRTPGAYLHDWKEAADTMKTGPTILATTEAALGTFWTRGGRDPKGSKVHVVLDDTNELHAGALMSTDIAT